MKATKTLSQPENTNKANYIDIYSEFLDLLFSQLGNKVASRIQVVCICTIGIEVKFSVRGTGRNKQVMDQLLDIAKELGLQPLSTNRFPLMLHMSNEAE